MTAMNTKLVDQALVANCNLFPEIHGSIIEVNANPISGAVAGTCPTKVGFKSAFKCDTQFPVTLWNALTPRDVVFVDFVEVMRIRYAAVPS